MLNNNKNAIEFQLKWRFESDKMDKKAIRKEIKRQTLALTTANSESQSETVVKRLLEIISQREPQTVALFSPLKDEVQIGSLMQRIECRVVVPRVEGDEMEFYDLASGSLVEGTFGIMEPQSGEPIEPRKIDVMVVPGVAFTPSGDRLGRGKGYYDRYLSREGFRAYCVGVCYPHQMVDELPVEPHDRRMDEVVSGMNSGR